VEKQVETMDSEDATSLRLAEREKNEATRLRDEAQQSLTSLRNDFAERYPAYRTLCGLDTPTMATYTELLKNRPDTLFCRGR